MLADIEILSEDISRRLRDCGIRGIDGLLREGTTRKGRLRVGLCLGIGQERVRRFVTRADLMRIKGIGGGYAELLEAAGVHSVQELSRMEPTLLADALLEVNLLRERVRAVPSEKRVAGWIKQASELGS